MSVRRGALATAIGLVAAAVLSSCSLFPCAERRHDSGLLIVCADETRPLPEALGTAGSFAWALADEHPDAFGYPWADPATGAVELRVTGPQAGPFIDAWLAGTATRGTGEKTLPLPRPDVPVRRVTVDRSVRQLTDIMNAVTPPKGLPDADAVWMAGPDMRRNAIVIGIDHESDVLLRALAAKYGTSAIVIHIERRDQSMPL